MRNNIELYNTVSFYALISFINVIFWLLNKCNNAFPILGTKLPNLHKYGARCILSHS